MNTPDRVIARLASTLAQASNAPGPKYEHLARALLVQIEAGAWKPGARLPADSVFQQALPLSLGTIQQALRKLVQIGVLERRYRIGTFVRDIEVHSEIRHLRFIAPGQDTLAPVTVRVIDIARVEENTTNLGPALVAVGDLVRVRRLCTINAEFRVYLETFLPADRVGSLLHVRPSDVHGISLSTLLKEKFNAPTARTEHCLRIAAVSEHAGSSLGLEASAQVIDWCMYSYSHEGGLLMAQRAAVPRTTNWITVVST